MNVGGIGKKVARYAAIAVLTTILDVWMVTPMIKLQQIMSGNLLSDASPDMSPAMEMFKNPFKSLKFIFSSSHNFSIWIGVSLALVALVLGIAYMAKGNGSDKVKSNGKDINFSKTNGTYGTAQWMNMEQLKQLTKQYIDISSGKGILYGTLKMDKSKKVTLPKKSWFNRNIAVYGASGSGKSRKFVRNNIMNLAIEGESMCITDPKGELAQDCIPFLKKRGYNCKILNLVNMIHSDRWNPLGEVTDDLTAQTFAQVVIDNTSSPNAKADEFWTRTEMNLMKALALYVVMEIPKPEANMATMYSLISTKDPKKTEKIFELLDEDHPALKPFNLYKQASEAVRTGVVIGLGTRLQIFQSKLMQKLTEVSEIDLTEPGKSKCAYFIVIPDSESTFDFIAGLFFSFMFIKLMKMADYSGGKLPVQVNFLLDEFPNVAKIPDFCKKIATIRSRGLNTIVIFQNIAQLQNRYPNNEWAEILGNCDTHLFLGCNDPITAKFISDTLGTATVDDFSVSRQQGFEALFDFGKRSDKVAKRMLLNSDEVRMYDNDEAILIMRGQNPLQLYKYDYTEHKLAKELKPRMLKEYHKDWATEFEYLEKRNEEMYSILNIKGNISNNIIDEKISEGEVAATADDQPKGTVQMEDNCNVESYPHITENQDASRHNEEYVVPESIEEDETTNVEEDDFF